MTPPPRASQVVRSERPFWNAESARREAATRLSAVAATPASPVFTPADIEWVVVAALALLFVLVGRRVREPGMGLLALGFSMAALWYWRSDSLVYSSPDIIGPEMRAWSLLIGAAVVVVSAGVVRYLGFPDGPTRWMLVACWIPAVLLLGAIAIGLTVSHHNFHNGVLVAYVGAAVLAIKRGHDHPGEAHWPLAAALLALAALPHVMQAFGVDPLELRHPAGVSLALFGMILLVVILLRGQRALSTEVHRRSAAEVRLHDVNAQLEARVAERTSHLKELVAGLEAFNHGVSHDLRGPLSGMAQLARLAADELDTGRSDLAREALPAIAEQCEASTRMVNAMLDLARMGGDSSVTQLVEPGGIIRAAFDEVLLTLTADSAPEVRYASLPAVYADPRLLRTVFVNLLANAVKFSRGCPDALIEVGSRDARDGTVVYFVRDNGVGISADDVADLFEPFYRARDSEFDGHGLGLSIVRRAVVAMGGEVWAEVGSTGGAEICVRLPTPQRIEDIEHIEDESDTAGV